MPKIKSPSDIQFLALEGGGGKGAAYLGAIQFLETKGVLPIKLNSQGTNQIKGISGASAGAITALFLAVGYTSPEIEQILDGKKMPWGGSYDFRKFLDNPYPSVHIILNEKNIIDLESKFWYKGNDFEPNLKKLNKFNQAVSTKSIIAFVASLIDKNILDSAINFPSVRVLIDFYSQIKDVLSVKRDTEINQKLILIISLLILTFIEKVKKEPNEFKKIREELEKLNLVDFIKEPSAYLYSLLYNNGLLVAIEPLNLFAKAVEYKIGTKIPLPTNKSIGISRFTTYDGLSNKSHIVNLNFKDFYKITGVDLVLTGTNITDGKPAVFSYRHTPLIPVIIAVRLSMGLPAIFRPVYIKAKVEKNVWSPDENYYLGEWVDGGFLNNFPLHAFDFYPNNPMETKLNPNVLGIRLTEPQTNTDKINLPVSLLSLLGRFVNTLMYPSESGQIRNAEEQEQTVDIDTGKLSTLVFSPSDDVKRPVIDKALKKMESYFSS
jgi:predicted acylesterase/phospholipase RssA